MTNIELQEYNGLSEELKTFYNLGMTQHPGWSHQQALTFAIICGEAGKIGPVPPPRPVPGEEQPQPEWKVILQDVLLKAEIFMQENFPRIYLSVKIMFETVITKVKSGLIKAWNEIMSWFA